MTAIATELSALGAALKCGERGLHVFSLHGVIGENCTCGKTHEENPKEKGKHPTKTDFFKDASTSTAQIQSMLAHAPGLNYGIATGREIGNTGKALVVIDVDSYKPGADDHLDDLIRRHGKLPDTAQVRTGGGGTHYYFAAPLGMKFKQKLGHDGIDIKGIGGYVVGPGSMHRSGQPYVTEASSDLFDGHEIADIPQWIIEHFAKVSKEPTGDAPDILPQEQTPLAPHEPASIRHDLGILSAACGREEWVNILMALHSRSAGLEMFKIADDWSQTCSEKYDHAALVSAWNSFKPDGGITYDYVLGLARKEMAKTQDLSKLMESLNKMPVTWADYGSNEVAEPPIQKPAPRYKLLSPRELTEAPPLKWTIRGLLPQTGVVALYGSSGVGKSFLTLCMCAAIAGADIEWFGMRVANRPVIYCALEGEAGMGKRVQAWEKIYKMRAPETLKFMTQSFNLMREDDVAELAEAIIASDGAGAVVVIDTLNRAAPDADENTSKDMGKIISNAKKLQKLVGGLILFVHHSGKQQDAGLREHSSLKAAMDCVIHVHSTGKGLCWVAEKSKDDESGRAYMFRLETVVVGEDDEGVEITSCAAISTVPSDALRKAKSLGKHQTVAMNVLQRLFGTTDSPDGIVEYQTAVTSVAAEIDATPNHKTSRAKEAITALGNQRLIYLGGGYVAPAGHVPDDEGDDEHIMCRVGN